MGIWTWILALIFKGREAEANRLNEQNQELMDGAYDNCTSFEERGTKKRKRTKNGNGHAPVIPIDRGAEAGVAEG